MALRLQSAPAGAVHSVASAPPCAMDVLPLRHFSSQPRTRHRDSQLLRATRARRCINACNYGTYKGRNLKGVGLVNAMVGRRDGPCRLQPVGMRQSGVERRQVAAPSGNPSGGVSDDVRGSSILHCMTTGLLASKSEPFFFITMHLFLLSNQRISRRPPLSSFHSTCAMHGMKFLHSMRMDCSIAFRFELFLTSVTLAVDSEPGWNGLFATHSLLLLLMQLLAAA